MFYVGQGLYQVGGERLEDKLPVIRDAIVKSQYNSTRTDVDGSWEGGRLAALRANSLVPRLPSLCYRSLTATCLSCRKANFLTP